MLRAKTAETADTQECQADDRREWVRFSCDVDFSCQPLAVNNESRWLGKVLNISQGGMCLVVNRRFERGTILAVEMYNNVGAVTGTMLARVVHCAPQSHSDWMIGCSFVRALPVEDLRAFVVPDVE